MPWTVLRTTQFHEFAGQVLARTRGRIAPVPAMPSRPVSVAEVADALVDAVLADPLDGYATELAGPDVLRLDDMARRCCAGAGSGDGCCRCGCRVGSAGSCDPAERCRGGDFREGKLTFADYLATIGP